MRYIEITDEKLVDLVKEKFELVDKFTAVRTEVQEKIDQAEKDITEINGRIQEVKDEINDSLDKMAEETDIDEFEEFGSTEMKGDTCRVPVIDKLANAKDALRKDKENRDRLARGEYTPEELLKQKMEQFHALTGKISKSEAGTTKMTEMIDKLIETAAEYEV